jgi:DNA-binding NarL/FixJ family response regulator
MNGLQVLEVLRNWNPAVRVVISSGYTIEHEGDRLLPAGVHGFIAKPYRPEKLVQTVRQALDPQVSKAAGPCNTASVTARPG